MNEPVLIYQVGLEDQVWTADLRTGQISNVLNGELVLAPFMFAKETNQLYLLQHTNFPNRTSESSHVSVFILTGKTSVPEASSIRELPTLGLTTWPGSMTVSPNGQMMFYCIQPTICVVSDLSTNKLVFQQDGIDRENAFVTYWSEDSRYLFYSMTESRTGEYVIYQVDTSTGKQSEFLRNKQWIYRFLVGPSLEAP